ncbi:MAG: efflux RND transporter periplasmic adaptor subunit [Pseudomonadota bacterium]
MKKPFYSIFLAILLLISFLGGAWYSHHETVANSGKDRRILHYVDPMNPLNVSDKPGIAPCGMPMEPVYGDAGYTGTSPSDTALSMTPGTVRITPRNQQVIGVTLGVVERMPGTYEIRTLGRVTPDENRVYPVLAGTDGWSEVIQGNTTGSLVKKDQILARLNIYNYDFFSWQQRYITESANWGQRRYLQTPGETRRPGALQPPQSDNVKPDGTTDAERQPVPQLSESPFPDTGVTGAPPSSVSPSETGQYKGRVPADIPGLSGRAPKSLFEGRMDATLYANRGKVELLNLGMKETQLQELSQTSHYMSAIELRSPVNGFVISRAISSHQRVDRGTECFRIADLDRVWIIADVFYAEAPYIRPGMSAKISLPGQVKQYEAMVSDVLPTLDPVTRSLKVRLEMDNPKNLLLPEMFVDVEFPITLPSAVTVPASAILDSGRKKTVFVAMGDGRFEPRSVETGWRFGDRVEIVRGLQPGEKIVTSGNFLIDSESRMRLAAAGHSGTPAQNSPEKPPQGVAQTAPDDNTKKNAPGSMGHHHD